MKRDVAAFLKRYIAATSPDITIGPVTFYHCRGDYFARSKSSLTGEQVKTEARFARTMANARKTAQASKIASYVYSQLPEGWKLFAIFQTLTGLAIRQLHAGKTPIQIEHVLWNKLKRDGYRADTTTDAFAENELPPNLLLWKVEEQERMATAKQNRKNKYTMQPIHRGAYGTNRNIKWKSCCYRKSGTGRVRCRSEDRYHNTQIKNKINITHNPSCLLIV